MVINNDDDKGTPSSSSSNQDTLQEDDQGYLVPNNLGGQADDHIYERIPANSGAQDDDPIYENIYDEIPANSGAQENDDLYDDVILPHVEHTEHTYANVIHYDHIELMEPVHIFTETLEQDNSDLPGTSLSSTCTSSHRSKSSVNQR